MVQAEPETSRRLLVTQFLSSSDKDTLRVRHTPTCLLLRDALLSTSRSFCAMSLPVTQSMLEAARIRSRDQMLVVPLQLWAVPAICTHTIPGKPDEYTTETCWCYLP